MFGTVDLRQPARVQWKPGVESAPITRHFGSLRDALIFVRTELKEEERGAARVEFDSPPYSLDYADPNMHEKAILAGLDLNKIGSDRDENKRGRDAETER
jgi:hypothetical protein